MSFIESLLVRGGSALAGPLYTAWRRRTGRTEQNARTLSDLIALDSQNEVAQRRIEREITSIAEYISETLLPVFEIDGAIFAENQKSAITIALCSTLEDGGINPSVLLEQDLVPERLTAHYIALSKPHRRDFTVAENVFLMPV